MNVWIFRVSTHNGVSCRAMKSNGKFHDRAYKLSSGIVKLSGYAFYSVRETENGNVEFHQTWLDHLVFAISIVFSAYTVIGGIAKSFELKLKSAILGTAMMAFFQIFIIGTVMAKLNSFLYARTSFKILYELKWIDRMVDIFK